MDYYFFIVISVVLFLIFVYAIVFFALNYNYKRLDIGIDFDNEKIHLKNGKKKISFQDITLFGYNKKKKDVRILIDNGEWFYTCSCHESTLNMSEQPYKHLVETLDAGGYAWFYTYPDAVPLQTVCYKNTINLSEIKGKTETEQDTLINERLGDITPSGKRYPWPSS